MRRRVLGTRAGAVSPPHAAIDSTLATSGSIANTNGRTVEDVIADILHRKRYNYRRQYPVGKGIYGTQRKVDFCVWGSKPAPDGLIIEVKWQHRAGSVDEKFPYLVENIALHPYPTIIVLDGDGFKPSAREWLIRQAGRRKNLLAVFRLGEFVSWTLQNL